MTNCKEMDWEASANDHGAAVASMEYAKAMDLKHPSLRSEFHIPVHSGAESIYLCGNSLGLQPKITRELVNQELDVWADSGVEGHFDHPHGRPWVSIDDTVKNQSAVIVGAKPSEVAIMNSLTANIHFLMISFYTPTPDRFKIIMEAKAFPSDYYAIASQVRLHGFDPDTAIIQIEPRIGEYSLETSDILKIIEDEGSNTALVLMSGVQFYTGQVFDIQTVTKYAKAKV